MHVALAFVWAVCAVPREQLKEFERMLRVIKAGNLIPPDPFLCPDFWCKACKAWQGLLVTNTRTQLRLL